MNDIQTNSVPDGSPVAAATEAAPVTTTTQQPETQQAQATPPLQVATTTEPSLGDDQILAAAHAAMPVPTASTVQQESNPFLQKVKALTDEGLSEAQIIERLSIPAVINGLSDKDVLRRDVSAKYPTLSAQEVDVYLANQFGVENLEDLSEFASAKLKIAAHDARANLLSGIQTSTPTTVPAQQEVAPQTTSVQAYEAVSASLSKQMSTLAVGEGDTAFGFKVPDATLAELPAALSKVAVAQKIPLNVEGLQQLREIAKQTIFAMHGPEIAAAAAKDAAAKALRANKQAEVNPNPVAPPTVLAPGGSFSAPPKSSDGYY